MGPYVSRPRSGSATPAHDNISSDAPRTAPAPVAARALPVACHHGRLCREQRRAADAHPYTHADPHSVADANAYSYSDAYARAGARR